MDSLCHPWFTTTNLSYRFPIFETSATALCGTTGISYGILSDIFSRLLFNILYRISSDNLFVQRCALNSEGPRLRSSGTHWAHTDSFTHRHFYTQTPLHIDTFTHRLLYTQTLLHTDTFTHRSFYTQKLLHTNTFTYRDHTHQITILLQFLTFNVYFVRKDCDGPNKIAILPQFLMSISRVRVTSDTSESQFYLNFWHPTSTSCDRVTMDTSKSQFYFNFWRPTSISWLRWTK